MSKEEIARIFRKRPEKYWRVGLFDEKGFVRKLCPVCGKGFWTIDPERQRCPEPSCGEEYGFIGKRVTKQRWDYIKTWKLFEKFFVKHGHASINRYPVLARWRPDLYFTIASIVDFQRIEDGVMSFDYPANPLIVPQVCLRFDDLPNVGVSGRHNTAFMMSGQHAFNPPREGYWKDKCIQLNFDFLGGWMGIPEHELVYVEEVWTMPDLSAFGPYLETFCMGLELVNSGFMEFTHAHGFKELPMKVVDVGWGHERLVWLSNATPTSYDAVFGPVIRKLMKMCNVEHNSDIRRYWELAGRIDVERFADIKAVREQIAKRLGVDARELEDMVAPFEALYAIADHTRALLFAISDSGMPSNVGGGYNLRVILRRTLDFVESFDWELDLLEICEMHARYLKPLFPELSRHLEEVGTILKVEERRYKEARKRARQIIHRILEAKQRIDEYKLVELYESHGITPELLLKEGARLEIPPDFYSKVTKRHVGREVEKHEVELDLTGLPPTKLLFYEDPDLLEFEARVLRTLNGFVVLDRTAFYPRGGGQEPDHGMIGKSEVIDVVKYGNVVLHRVKECKLREGDVVGCKVDGERRLALTRHHSATHILNAAAREVLGSWVWQHGALKEIDRARLDLTHFEKLSLEQLRKIEEAANLIVERDLPINISTLPRIEAEQRFGFRIYQGGVPPTKLVRVVSIGNVDHQACGGTHCKTTREVGYITILRSKRIADGICRLEFCSGKAALAHLERKASILEEVAELLGVREERVPAAVKELFERWKGLRKELRRLRGHGK
jgi:alanyl-tRNA synthetase